MELCQPALLLHPAWDSLMLGSFDVATAQPPASAGTIILDTDPNRAAAGNCGCALPDTLRNAWGLLLGIGEMGPASWGSCSGQGTQGTTPLDKSAMKERSKLSGGFTGECQDLHRDNTLKTMQRKRNI